MSDIIYPIQVQIEDTDFTGVVYHANYLNYFERARSAWAQAMGMTIEWWQENQLYLAVGSMDIQFIRPIRVHDELEVVTIPKKFGRASAIFEQELRMAGTPDKICCKAVLKVACVDQAEFKPRPFPDDSVMTHIREKI